MSYKFAVNSEPDQQNIVALQKLCQIDEKHIKSLVDAVVSFFASGQGEQFLNTLQSLSQSSSIPVAALKNMGKGLIVMFKGAFQNSLSLAHFTEDLNQLGFQGPICTFICDKWRASQSTLTTSSLGKTLSVNKLLLPEWRFGITSSNKELQNAGSTFMQLKLVLDKGDGEKYFEHIELTLPQFYEFLATLGKAKAQLDFFSF